MTIKPLDWDSTFFNRKVGELEIENQFHLDSKKIDLNHYDLLYVKQIENEFLAIDQFLQTFVETKVTFSKHLSLQNSIEEGFIFSIFNLDVDIAEIYELAFESGKYSRFKLDPNFEQSEFEALYKMWVNHSLNKKYADAVLVYKEQNKILGFVTYKILENIATIGLIAVCPKQQGKGIGKKLLASVENELVNNDVKELRIPTQLQNEIACRFYTKMGYQIIEEKFIKHFWKL